MKIQNKKIAIYITALVFLFVSVVQVSFANEGGGTQTPNDHGKGGQEEKKEEKHEKVAVCHYPPGNLNNPHLLTDQNWEDKDDGKGHKNHGYDFVVENPGEDYKCPPINKPVNQPPTLTLNGDEVVYITQGNPYVDAGATATDPEDGPLTVITTGLPVDTSVIGTSTITYNAKDSKDVSAPEVTRTVIVIAKAVDPEPEYPYGEIIAPTLNQTVSGLLNLVAEYYDGDQVNDDAVQWAVRKGTCAANTSTVFGNVDGFSNSFSWDGKDFSSQLDFSEKEEGEYCFVFNPTDDGPVDVRETVTFTIKHDDEGDQNQAPSITLNGSSTISIIEGDVYVDAGATAADPEDKDITEDIVIVGTVDTNTPGTYVLTYNVTDSEGASAPEVTRTVIVLPKAPDDEDEDEEGGDDEIIEEEDQTPEPTTRSRRSGSKKRVASAPRGEVLGATTEYGSCGMYLKDYLKKGQQNNPEQVTKLQKFLNDQGIFVPVTGFFGSLTDEAVRKFQSSKTSEILNPWTSFGYQERPTGYVYKTTRHTINNIVCPGSEKYPVLP